MPDLKAIVQRMIDAGESEENIATVIKAQKASDPTSYENTFRSKWGMEPMLTNRSMEAMNTPLARPTGIDAIDSLTAPGNLIVDAAMGAAPAARLAGRAAGAVRGPVAGALDLGAAALDNPVAGTISPRAGNVGKLLGAAADFIRPKAAQAAAPVAAEAVPVAEAVVKAAPYQPNKALQAAKDAFDAIGQKPLKAEASNAMELIRRGKTPEEAIDIVMKNRPAGPVAVPKPAPAANIKLTAEETRLGMDLMARGKTPQEALDAVLAQRAFKAIPGVQSNATVTNRVANRNATGRWD